jgi:iron(III) transport system permease protein
VLLGAAATALERRRGGRFVAPLVTLTFVLPGSTLAVGLLVAYGRWVSSGTTLILLAYLAKFWALAQRPLSGAADRLPAAERSAARVSGAGAFTAARTVLLPPLAPALLTAWLLVALTALHEVTMSSLLYGPGGETFAVVVLNSQDLGRVGPTAALSVLLTLVVAVPAAVVALGTRRVRNRPRPAAAPVAGVVAGAR